MDEIVRRVITTASAPTPMAHYCQGVVAGDTVYAAGQIASDYATGVAPEARVDPAFPFYGSEIQRQTRYVLNNLRATFAEAGCTLADVVKSQVFLTDLRDFYHFDQVWKEFFPSPPPRTTVEVGGLLVPGCRVEIDLVAVKPAVPRRVITTASAPTPMAHYCQGVVAGDTVYAAGQIASDYATGVAPEARVDPAFPFYGSEIQRQTRYVLNNLRATFAEAGCTLADVVKSQVFLTDLRDFYHFDQVWKEFFPSPPPRTTVEVGGLLVPGCRVEIDLVAVKPTVPRRVITTASAPTPMAHYCQGVVAGDTVYAAGQIASDYATGVAPEARVDPAFPFYGSEIQRQTRYVLNNLRATFAEAGCTLADVVKSQVFLTDLRDFYHFDQVWKEFFPSPPPRTTVEVGGLLVPGCRVEIDLVAVKPTVPRRVITTASAPTPMAHYCQGVVAGDTVYAAGQIASDYATGVAPEARVDPAFPFYGSEIQRQTRYVLNNLRATFAEAGCTLADVVKSQVFLTDLRDFYHFDQVWKEFFPSPPPRTTVEVGGLLVPGCRVEIDLVAVKR